MIGMILLLTEETLTLWFYKKKKKSPKHFLGAHLQWDQVSGRNEYLFLTPKVLGHTL